MLTQLSVYLGRYISYVLAAVGLCLLVACAKPRWKDLPSIPPSPASPAMVSYTVEVIASWPHDPQAFTQGLVYRNGSLLESTGLYGRSTLREINIKSGRSMKQVDVGRQFFAEGLAVIADRAFQLTWQNHKGFIYDADTFRLEGDFAYDGEGWGLTTDGQLLILSDGTNRLRFLDPTTFSAVRTIEVVADGKPVNRLNELEWVKGEVFANVWQTDEIVRIDPASGQVRGRVDLSGLLARADREPETDVLNGIAYDAVNDRLFVTGKRWPKLFQIRLKIRDQKH